MCVILLDKFNEFQPGTSFIRWACQIAKYEVLSFRRRSQRTPSALSEAEIELLAERQMEMEPQLVAAKRLSASAWRSSAWRIVA